jgi:hypothetical protein
LTGTNVTLNAVTPPIGLVTGVGTDFDGSVAGGDAEIAAGDFIVILGVPYAVESVTGPTTLLVQNAGSGFYQPLPPADVPATTNFFKYTRTPKLSTVSVATRTINSITVTAHGVNIFNDFPTAFFTDYMPFQYGGHNINTPTDIGALMINYCLFPGTYQPSGHFNLSRAREFYIEYTSSVISSSVRGTLIILGIAINFLLVSDGSAVLRYST